MENIIKIDQLNSIRQSNNLVEARYSISNYEQRMVIAICSQLQKNADEFEKVRIRVRDMAEFCHFKGKDAYWHVKSIIMKLLGRILRIQDINGNWYATHWLQSAEYFANEGIIEYCVDNRLKPELLKLRTAYLDTAAAPLMEFKRDYSARMYFILKKMIKIREFEYSIEYFRDRFQLGKSYEKFNNIKVRVIDPAIQEINEKSDIIVEHKYIKEQKLYSRIHFMIVPKIEINKNKDIKLQNDKDDDLKKSSMVMQDQISLDYESKTLKTSLFKDKNLKSNDSEYAIESIVIEGLKAEGITSTMATKLSKYGDERCSKNIEYALELLNKNPNYKNYDRAGFIVKAIEEDYAGAAERKFAAKKRDDDKKRARENEILLQERAEIDAQQKEVIINGNMSGELPEIIAKMVRNSVESNRELSKIMQDTLKKYGLTVNDVISGKRKSHI